LLGKSTLEARVKSNTSSLEGDLNIVAPTTKPHRAHQEWSGIINALVLPLDEADAKRNGVKAPGVVKLQGVVHKPQGSLVGGASSDIVADQVPQQRGGTSEETGKTTGVALRYIDAVFATILEVNQRARAAKFCNLCAPGCPGLCGLVDGSGLRVTDAHLVGQISRPPRSGVEGITHRGGSVIIIGTPHPPNVRLRL
jgi:hypothetical protein